MSLNSSDFVLPRPGEAPGEPRAPIAAPSESAFTETFGSLLPPAKYLETPRGRAAYYELAPSTPGAAPSVPDRVLLIHGVQTPALGLLPLTRALRASFPGTHFALVDLWGHGLTETPIVPHEPSLFHELIDAVLDKLEWPIAHFVGYSFGSVLTVGYSTSRPSRVQSFALIAPAGMIRSAEFSAEQKGYLRSGCDEVAARKWVLEFLEGGDLVVPADWKERVARGEVVAEAVKEWEMREHPGHTASVVGVVRDGGVLDNSDAFAQAARTGIPSVVVLDVFVVPQAGHAVSRNQAPEVAVFIKDFWTKLGQK